MAEQVALTSPLTRPRLRVAGNPWDHWPDCRGMGGRIAVESAQVVGNGQEVAHLAQFDAVQAGQRIALVGHVAMLGPPPPIHNAEL